jgi:hypothetical protein
MPLSNTLRPPKAGFAPLNDKVSENYYAFGDDWRLSLAKRYGINYLVLIKERIVQQSRLPVAYENDRFLVLLARE